MPAIRMIKEIISTGQLGSIVQFRVSYLHGSYMNPQKGMSWRLRQGSGALLDLGPHVIDLINFLVGDITDIQGRKKTVIKNRPRSQDQSDLEDVTVDDIAWIQCNTKNGASGVIEVSRLALGSIDDLRLEINGEKGSVKWSLENLNFLEFINESNIGFYQNTCFPIIAKPD